jgi:glycosyltransferase involved in cell wall biosynthesis
MAPMRLGDVGAEPLVSVLITNFNYGRFVGEAIESVLAQGYERFEVIVCDDGSSDDSCEVVEGYVARDPRVQLIAKGNGGQASAFNAAYAASSGSILCFLDADDVFLAEKLARVVRAFRDSAAGLLVHHMMIVDDVGHDLQRIPTFTRFEHGWIGDRVIERGGRWRWMPTSGVALRREVAERIFPVPEEPFRIDADMFMLELAPLFAEVTTIDEVLGHYRLHGGNAYSQRKVDRQGVARTIRSITTAIDQANDKLAQLGIDGVRLDPRRNLKLTEQRFLLRAFDGHASRWELARTYARLAPSLIRDDLYGVPQKAWALLLYLGVVILPADSREPWASASLGISHGKELVRRVQQAAPRRVRAWLSGGGPRA